MFPITVNHEVSRNTIQGLLCSALEGGSNYWYEIKDKILPEGVTYEDFKEGGRFTDPDEYWHPMEIIPLTPGCSLVFTADEDDDETYLLNLDTIQKGIKIMAEKYPQVFQDVVTENDDAGTGDVFLQCCLFGKIIYC